MSLGNIKKSPLNSLEKEGGEREREGIHDKLSRITPADCEGGESRECVRSSGGDSEGEQLGGDGLT